jgi:phosphoserine phosphatase
MKRNGVKLVCFDLDGTLIDGTVYIWQTLYETFVKDWQSRRGAARDYYSGKITYEEWFSHDIEVFRTHDVTRDKMVQCIRSLKLMKGARETLRVLGERGLRLALVSGSLSIVLDELFPDHPFHHVLINQVHFDDLGNITGGTATEYDVEKKAEGLALIAENEGISLDECVFVGDNENDITIAEKAGYAIAFNCKSEKLAALADVVIIEKDLTAILPYVS